MKRPLLRMSLVSLTLLVWALASAMPGARHQEKKQAVRIEGAVEKSRDWTVERLSREFAGDLKTVSYTLKGEKGEAHCLSLLSLIQAAKPRLNAKVKNHSLAFVAIVQADDGYTVTFSMGELLAAYGKRDVWLALDRNGKPLSDREGPIQLIVPEDEKPSRWVHGVSSITLVDGFQAAARKRK